jgi:2-polyprenyl-3-methyl-5-hydroxy-6-metoxy-1,4-benzoquinol methylase
MRHVTCNLCGADDPEIVFPKGFAQLHQIVRCKCCGLMYANPQEKIDCESMNDTNAVSFDPASPYFKQYFQKQLVQLPDNLHVLQTLNTLFPTRGKLLEIGSFAGIFLEKIRAAGWDVTGLEPDSGPADYARDRLNLPIVKGLLPHSELQHCQFDVVVMLHVIEHMPNPSSNLAEIRKLMKRGGVFVVETPRFDSLIFRILGRRERSLSNCNGHIYFFTVPTLRALLEKCGFQVFKVELVGRTLTLDRLAYNVGLVSRNAVVKKYLQKASSAFHLDKRQVHINLRDMQRLYCRAA